MTIVALPRVMSGASGRPLTLREHEVTFGTASVGALAGELEASGPSQKCMLPSVPGSQLPGMRHTGVANTGPSWK